MIMLFMSNNVIISVILKISEMQWMSTNVILLISMNKCDITLYVYLCDNIF